MYLLKLIGFVSCNYRILKEMLVDDFEHLPVCKPQTSLSWNSLDTFPPLTTITGEEGKIKGLFISCLQSLKDIDFIPSS